MIRIKPMILEFCPNLSQEKKRNESIKQHDEDHHTSNLSLVILNEHNNPRSNLYLITWQRRFPGGMIHGGAYDSF
jgi:hypothetical protein